ncbi:hypothetical protein LJR164_001629 [Phenylobacterium sp. LjRoot164]|uniref:hypothetical protein n=1 Tax=unclassified Phenylobacterium TaxID=2640670 RepID=UPI003ED0B8FE
MKARFVGDPRRNGEGPDVMHLYGVDFPKGEWVGDLPRVLEAKLPGNNHFETSDGLSVGGVSDIVPGQTYTITVPEAAQAEPSPSVGSFAAFDPDGDGKPGGSTSSAEKDALFAQLDGLGAQYDRRWGPARLQAALEVAQFQAGED